MADCECLTACPFFNDQMTNMPAVADLMKRRYCHTDSSTCARFMVFKRLGRDKVPVDLFPNQADYAERVLAAK